MCNLLCKNVQSEILCDAVLLSEETINNSLHNKGQYECTAFFSHWKQDDADEWSCCMVFRSHASIKKTYNLCLDRVLGGKFCIILTSHAQCFL